MSWQRASRAPRLVRALRGVRAASLAAGHTCSAVVDGEGAVHAMGYGRFWQLGLGHDRDQETPREVEGLHDVAEVAFGGLHAVAVKRGGQVLAWGGNEHGCLGIGQAGRAEREPSLLPKVAAASVSCGWQHTAAVGSAGELLTWGWGGSAGEASSVGGEAASGGQLGLGDDFDRWTPQRLSSVILDGGRVAEAAGGGEAAPRVRFLQVSCGFNHTAAVIEVAAP
uniref:Ultraviolet-b receptor uvr8-like n=1 Tax=Tetraselmis sp. GSL018 TaxID=582737 RepID=A0A061R106_9CHLO